MVEVDFGPAERAFRHYALLEPVRPSENATDLILNGRFADHAALRRLLTLEKVKGNLTNIFYSMESSNTDFYAHQFKPVLNFIESPLGRMLIADEVGLGKTIEAMFIWKEIQARHNARRLLIVCPAMLREKWRGDLKKRFNIAAEIVSANTLLDRLSDIAASQSEDTFNYIVSLESIRTPSDFADDSLTSVRAKLSRLLDAHPASEHFALLDYVVIDEAHYLRNPATGNHRIANLLQEAARHLALLTATPIQLGSDNLYQLLRLIDPDEFYDSALFAHMLSANSHIVRAQRALWRMPPHLHEARTAVAAALAVDYFKKDAVLQQVFSWLCRPHVSDATRIDALRILEQRSLLSLYMTRSRKREVLEGRVQRTAQALQLEFNPSELALYQHVTNRIRLRAQGQTGASLFSLISRQRQMASSIVGALESWEDKGVVEELLWEDLGLVDDLLGDIDGTAPGDAGEGEDTPGFGAAFDIADLEHNDSKYQRLRDLLRGELRRNPKEKFVVFAFFRGTLKYLHRRLEADGVSSVLLVGDMGDAKDEAIARFADADGPSVLLSSEVGSEGIDLQFCRFLVNYDLPWNPMKVEQRIGRLDRLGQRAERISILNLIVTNTIEDRVLQRLYDRINVFRESIGDLEEILGDVSENLLPHLLDPTLTDEERERRAMQTADAIENRRNLQAGLEREAVNLVGFSDYILENIKDSHDRGRWLSASELAAFVEDFFSLQYPGTIIAPGDDEGVREITLSSEARRDLSAYIAQRALVARTRLHQSAKPTLCIFDPRAPQKPQRNAERMDPTHPLVQWIRDEYQKSADSLFPLSALKAPADTLGVPPGDYAYCIQRWSFTGLKSEHKLVFCAAAVRSREILTGDRAEELVYKAGRVGVGLPNAANVIGSLVDLHAVADLCESTLGDLWMQRATAFEAENAVRCDQQEISADRYAKRKIGGLEERLERFRRAGKQRLLPMTQGLIERERELFAEKLGRITRCRNVDPMVSLIATGVIRAE